MGAMSKGSSISDGDTREYGDCDGCCGCYGVEMGKAKDRTLGRAML